MKLVNFGIVGLNFGAYIAERLLEPPARRYLKLRAVCDADAARSAAAVVRLGVPEMGFEELLRDPEIQALGIFTGPQGRASLISRAFAAGKDVLTTKPFENDVEAAQGVLAEARKLRRVLHLNSPSALPSKDMAQIQSWCREYRLGRLVGIRGDAWGSYQERADGSWYDDPSTCPVAPIFRLGIYLINDIIALAGCPSAIQVVQSRVRTGRPTPDNASVTLHFASGAIASIYASFCVHDGRPYRNGLAINFERGTIYRNVGPDQGGGTGRGSILALERPGRRGGAVVLRKGFSELSGDYQWANFARAVHARKPPTKTFDPLLIDGLRVIRALRTAADSGSLTPVT